MQLLSIYLPTIACPASTTQMFFPVLFTNNKYLLGVLTIMQ